MPISGITVATSLQKAVRKLIVLQNVSMAEICSRVMREGIATFMFERDSTNMSPGQNAPSGCVEGSE
jgi:hypothetical protein